MTYRLRIITLLPCAGPILGVPSSAMLGTPLSKWLSVPTTYDGLLLDAKKKGGALKKRAADIKIGPVLHATGQHFDGDKVKAVVQVCVDVGKKRRAAGPL